MEVPLVDLRTQYVSIKEEIDAAISDVILRTDFILGADVKALESEIAAYLGVRYALGVASGSDALIIALLACGIRAGDEVITTPFTFVASSEAITRCGAVPIFVDIDPRTYNIDTSKIQSKITKKTTAIIPVHLYGQSADMGTILRLAEQYNLKVIEDCAQAMGATYQGSRVGSLGDVGCLSFFPSKALGAYGDGGMVVTNSPEISQRVAILRNHGCEQKYYHLVHGFNSRLDSLQAAVLRVKLRHLDEWIDLRRDKASRYTHLIDEINGIEAPFISSDGCHCFNYYTIRLSDTLLKRNHLQKHLSSNGVATAIYYPLSLHLQEVYRGLGYRPGNLPQSEKAQESVLSLPIYPELKEQDIEKVIGLIKGFCEQSV